MDDELIDLITAVRSNEHGIADDAYVSDAKKRALAKYDARERAFRAMREALERVAEDAIQDDAVDDRVILPDETLTIVERALALAREVGEDA